MRLSKVPNSPEEDVGILLQMDGVGEIGKQRGGWGIFFGFDPPEPKQFIDLSSSSSISPQVPINHVGPDNDTGLVEYPIVQIRVGAATYEDAYKKLYQIAGRLRNRIDFTGDYWKYLTFRQGTVPLYLGQDAKDRHIFAADFSTVRTPIDQ